MEELKPCPFCGCGGKLVENHGQMYVTCYVCGAQGGKAYGGFTQSIESAKQEAVFKWNRRAKQ